MLDLSTSYRANDKAGGHIFGKYKCNSGEKSRGHVSRKNLTFIDMNRELGMKKKPSKNSSFCPIEKRNETDNANFL